MSQLFTGIALPWGTTIPSVIEPKTDLEVIKSSVIWIVLTGVGERVMRPTFGATLMSMLFNPMDANSMSQLKQSVQDAITQWDNRVAFIDFATTKVGQNTLKCSLSYRVTIDKSRSVEQSAEFTISESQIVGG